MNKYLYCEIVDNHVITCYHSREGYHYQCIGIVCIEDVVITDNFVDAKTAYDTLLLQNY